MLIGAGVAVIWCHCYGPLCWNCTQALLTHAQAKTVDDLYEQLAAERQRSAEARGLVADLQDELGAREQQVKELEHTLTEVQRVATAIEEDVRPTTPSIRPFGPEALCWRCLPEHRAEHIG